MKRITLPKIRRALDAVPLEFVERAMRIERFCRDGERARAIGASVSV
jgi:hypothetical protein